MTVLKALLNHMWLVMRLKHDGTGLPVKFTGAFVLVASYCVLVSVNKYLHHELTLETVLALCFIAQFYLFSIRNTVIGLIILIGVIANLFGLGMVAFGTPTELQITMLSCMQFLMVFGALINVIKTQVKSF